MAISLFSPFYEIASVVSLPRNDILTQSIDRGGGFFVMRKENKISRRRFISLGLGLAAGVLFPSFKSPLSASFPQFFFTQILSFSVPKD